MLDKKFPYLLEQLFQYLDWLPQLFEIYLQESFLEDRFQKVVATNPNIEIIVRGDRETSYQAIADLLGVLQANGAKNFSLATQP